MVNVLNHGSGSCVYSEGCHGVTQEHLERFAELVRADERNKLRVGADEVDAYLRKARALYFQQRGGASTPMAIFFNDALQANGTYEADHAAHEKREQAARDKMQMRRL